MTYPLHPAAYLFPEMSTYEYEQLREDIRRYGVREAIWLFDSQVIDGRHRQKAAEEVNVDCPTRDFLGTEDEVAAFVISLNKMRRHLNTAQAGELANSLVAYETGLADNRRREALIQSNKARGKDAETPVPQNFGELEVDKKDNEALVRAAKQVGVSHETARRVAKVKAADAELYERMLAGEVSVNAAYTDIKEKEAPTKTEEEIKTEGRTKMKKDYASWLDKNLSIFTDDEHASAGELQSVLDQTA